jgi:hypothetical protein
MLFGLKLLVLMFSMIVTIEVAGAQTDDGKNIQPTFKSMFSAIEVSCDTLIVAEFADMDFLQGGRSRKIDFDQTDCVKRLKPTQFAFYLQPLFDLEAKQDAEQPSTDKILESETSSAHEKRVERGNYELGTMQNKLQKSIRPLASVCRELGGNYNEKNVRVCYFGAPRASAGLPFQALFRSMIENTQSSNETVCAPDPITNNRTIVPEIRQFLKSKEESLSWSQVQKSLLNDGFDCRGDGDFAGCRRNLVMIAIPSPAMPSDDPNATWPGIKNGTVIIPRELSVYKGNWRVLGPGSRCLMKTEEDAIENCQTKPSRGSQNGICTAGEDWHVWGHLVALLNKEDE